MTYRNSPVAQAQADERETYLETWRREEVKARRGGGTLLVCAGMLAFAVEQTGDVLTATLATLLLTGGVWFLLRSGRTRIDRIHLSHLNPNQQTQRALMAGLAGAYVLYQGTQQSRPLFLIGSAVLALWAAWYQWRAMKGRGYRDLLASQQSDMQDKESSA